jgi:hypothetical protein
MFKKKNTCINFIKNYEKLFVLLVCNEKTLKLILMVGSCSSPSSLRLSLQRRAPCHARLDNWRDTGVRLVAYPSAPIIWGTYASVLHYVTLTLPLLTFSEHLGPYCGMPRAISSHASTVGARHRSIGMVDASRSKRSFSAYPSSVKGDQLR